MAISISVASGKGGVGKTSVAVNLAITMASMGSRVIFLDADFGLANANILMGINNSNTVADVLSGKMDLENVMVEGPFGLKLICGGSGLLELLNLDKKS